MSLQTNLFSPKPLKLVQNFQTNPSISYPSRTHFNKSSSKIKISISCSNKNSSNDFNDAELAIKLAEEVEKMNSQILQREEALNKSRELLFKELSSFMGLKDEEVKKKWRKLNEEEKWDLIKGFVSGWSDHFHPLSARSVKELVDEYLGDEKDSVGDSGTITLFLSLKKLIGFSQNNRSNKG